MSRYIRYGLISVTLALTLSYCLKVAIADEATKHYEAGLDQYKKGWYDQAIKEFEKAIELKQDYVSAHYGLGNAYYCKHLYDKAIKQYNKVLRYNTDHAKAHYALWLSYRALGMTGDADRELEIYKKLSSGQKVDEKDTSYSSGYSEEKDYTKSDERTKSWYAADSQTQVEAKAPSEGASHVETKKQEPPASQKQPSETVTKQESPTPQKQLSEAVKKPEEKSPFSQMLAQFEQKQKEPASAQPAAQPAHQEQPAKAKEEKKEAIETHKQAEAHDTHTSQPVVTHEQPSAPVATEVRVEGGTTPQIAPTPAKAVEQVQASGAVETKAPAPDKSATVPVEVKKPHAVVEKPRERVKGPGIKVRMEHIWKRDIMGKVIVSIAIYIFAAQVWITIVAMMGLFFRRRR